MPGREGRGGEGERRHLPGTMRLGWGGRGDCRGLPAGLPFNGERRGAGEPCAGGRGANPLVLRPPQSRSADLPNPLRRRLRRSLTSKGTDAQAGRGTAEGWDPRPASPAAASCPRLPPGSPAPQGWPCSALLQGEGKGGNNALMCLLSTESISQVSAAPHPLPACLPPSLSPSCHSILPFISSLSPTHSPVCLFAFRV